jgi:hypothetical protein
MPSESIALSRDGQWRVVLKAWKVSAGVYNAIGATIKAQHLETYKILFVFKRFGWVDKPVPTIDVLGAFEGTLPSAALGQTTKRDLRHNSPEADVRFWVAGISIKANVDTGGQTPGVGPELLIRSIRATGGATIGSETLNCAEVSAS